MMMIMVMMIMIMIMMMMLIMMMTVQIKQVVFWNDDDAFSHAGCAKILFRYSGVLIFYSHHGHFYHGRETIVNHVVASVIASQQQRSMTQLSFVVRHQSKVSLSCSVHVTFLDDDMLGTWPHGPGLLINPLVGSYDGAFLGLSQVRRWAVGSSVRP